MSIRDLFYETWHALSSNKGRSILTILGIVIGISAVIAMTALIGGVQNMLTSEMGLSTSRSFTILATSSSEPITMDALAEAEKALPDCEFLTGETNASATMKVGSKTTPDTGITGTTPEYASVVGIKLSQGSFFTQEDVDKRNRVIVLDKTTVNTLFGNENATVVGKTLKIGVDDYTIVGVTEPSGMVAGGGGAYIPYTTVQTRLSGDTALSAIYAYAREGVDLEALSTKLTNYFKTRYHITRDEDILVMSMDSIRKELDTMMSSFSLMMSAVASISLFVGGIGIMNMMLTNVTERIREIGLRKSLGARRRDVTMQFLLEAIALCVAGGVFGLLFGLGASFILSALVGFISQGLTVVPAISFSTIGLAVGVSVAIGLIFGFYPARRAAKLDPIESLRYQ